MNIRYVIAQNIEHVSFFSFVDIKPEAIV